MCQVLELLLGLPGLEHKRGLVLALLLLLLHLLLTLLVAAIWLLSLGCGAPSAIIARLGSGLLMPCGLLVLGLSLHV